MVAVLALPPLLTPVPAAAAAYSISASPSSLVFLQGESTHDLTITNTGTATVSFNANPIAPFNEIGLSNKTCSGIGTGAPGGTLGAGQSCILAVGFNPTQLGAQHWQIQLTYGPPPDGTGNQLAVPLTLYHYAFYGLYTLDAYGGIHPNGCQPLSGGPYWRGWRIARALALIPTQQVPGGYVLDGLGGVHPFGNAPAVSDWPRFGWDIARDIKLMPTANSSDAPGYVLDGWGGVHPFGGAAPVRQTAYWPQFDIAKKMVILPDGSGGYVLDGFGGLHPFSIGSSLPPPPMASAYWPGMNLARDVELNPGLSPIGGVTLDAWGGVHPFGSQPALAAPGPFWPYRDVARAIRFDDANANEGWIMDAYGGLHAFAQTPGSATSPAPPYPYWGAPLAVDLAAF